MVVADRKRSSDSGLGRRLHSGCTHDDPRGGEARAVKLDLLVPLMVFEGERNGSTGPSGSVVVDQYTKE